MNKYRVFFRGYSLGSHVITQRLSNEQEESKQALYQALNRGYKHSHMTVHYAATVN